MPDFPFGPNLNADGSLPFGPNELSTDDPAPVISSVSNHKVDEQVSVLLSRTVAEPVVSLTVGGVVYSNASEVALTNEIVATVERSGQIGADVDMVAVDQGGASDPFTTQREPQTGWTMLNDAGTKAFTSAFAGLPENSIYSSTELTGLAVGDQMSHQQVVDGQTFEFDGQGVLQGSSKPAGVYQIPSFRLDASNNYSSIDDTINLTVINSAPTIPDFTDLPIEPPSTAYTETVNITGLTDDVLMYHSGDGEISNDGGSTWTSGGSIAYVDGQSQARISGTSSAVSGQSVTQTLTVNGVSQNKVVTTTIGDTAPVFANPGYIIPASVGVNVPVNYAPQLTQAGDPAPLYSISAGALPSGWSIDANTGVISGSATAIGSGSFTVSATNNQGTGTTTINWVVNSGAPYLMLPPIRDASGDLLSETLLNFTSIRISDGDITRGTATTDINGNLQIFSGVFAAGVDYEVAVYLVGQNQSIADNLVTSEI